MNMIKTVNDIYDLNVCNDNFCETTDVFTFNITLNKIVCINSTFINIYKCLDELADLYDKYIFVDDPLVLDMKIKLGKFLDLFIEKINNLSVYFAKYILNFYYYYKDSIYQYIKNTLKVIKNAFSFVFENKASISFLK